MSTELSADIARRLDQKKACVRITDVRALCRCIDEQLDVEGLMGLVSYTADHNRDHFLKSDEDQWQREYRLFWKVDEQERWVVLPSGVATFVQYFDY